MGSFFSLFSCTVFWMKIRDFLGKVQFCGVLFSQTAKKFAKSRKFVSAKMYTFKLYTELLRLYCLSPIFTFQPTNITGPTHTRRNHTGGASEERQRSVPCLPKPKESVPTYAAIFLRRTHKLHRNVLPSSGYHTCPTDAFAQSYNAI
jgi:hypothetical protein